MSMRVPSNAAAALQSGIFLTKPGQTQAEVRRLRRAWIAKAKSAGLDDIEGEGGMLRGISLQEVARAPEPEEIAETSAYFSIATEWLGVRAWPEACERRVWAEHARGAALREIAQRERMPLKRAWSIVTRLRGECMAWWRERVADDAEEPRGRGRPRVDEPRVSGRGEVVFLRLTRDEARFVRAAAERANVPRGHAYARFLRGLILEGARRVPYPRLEAKAG